MAAVSFTVLSSTQAALLGVILGQFTNPKGFFAQKKGTWPANVEIVVFDPETMVESDLGPAGFNPGNTDFNSWPNAMDKATRATLKATLVKKVTEQGLSYTETEFNKDFDWFSRLCTKDVKVRADGVFGYVKRGGPQAGQVIWVEGGSGKGRGKKDVDLGASLDLLGIEATTPPVKEDPNAALIARLAELEALLKAKEAEENNS